MALLRDAKPLMGTVFSIAAPDSVAPGTFEDAWTEACALLRRIEEIYSPFIPESPVSRIRDGRLDGQLRDVAYQATTTDFWNSMEAIGGASTWRLGGAFNCGKAQPGQVAAVSHGCPSALFRGVNVLNTRVEGGR